MNNILLPTDLTISSLYPIHEICQNAGGKPCNIYIIHTLDTPSGIMDLLFLKVYTEYKYQGLYFTFAFGLYQGLSMVLTSR